MITTDQTDPILLASLLANSLSTTLSGLDGSTATAKTPEQELAETKMVLAQVKQGLLNIAAMIPDEWSSAPTPPLANGVDTTAEAVALAQTLASAIELSGSVPTPEPAPETANVDALALAQSMAAALSGGTVEPTPEPADDALALALTMANAMNGGMASVVPAPAVDPVSLAQSIVTSFDGSDVEIPQNVNAYDLAQSIITDLKYHGIIDTGIIVEPPPEPEPETKWEVDVEQDIHLSKLQSDVEGLKRDAQTNNEMLEQILTLARRRRASNGTYRVETS